MKNGDLVVYSLVELLIYAFLRRSVSSGVLRQFLRDSEPYRVGDDGLIIALGRVMCVSARLLGCIVFIMYTS